MGQYGVNGFGELPTMAMSRIYVINMEYGLEGLGLYSYIGNRKK